MNVSEAMQRTTPGDTTIPTLNRLKAKLVGLHSGRLQKLLFHSNEADRIEEEQSSR